jgi:hypothetical protein
MEEENNNNNNTEEDFYHCPICGKFGHTPNQETIDAIKEVENGGGVSFNSIKEFFEELHKD